MIVPLTWALTFGVGAFVFFPLAPTLPAVQAAYRNLAQQGRVWGAPPPAAFGLVWAVLFALIVANIVLYAGEVITAVDETVLYDAAYGLWVGNLVLVKLWAPAFNSIFLRPTRTGFWLLVLLTALVCGSAIAIVAVEVLSDDRWWLALLLAPYVLWTAYATTLMLQFAVANVEPPKPTEEEQSLAPRRSARAGVQRADSGYAF